MDGRPSKRNLTMVPVLSGYFRLYGREFNRRGGTLGPPPGGSAHWISLPFCARISQQRSPLSSIDTEFGVEEADEMLPDEIIDDENDG